MKVPIPVDRERDTHVRKSERGKRHTGERENDLAVDKSNATRCGLAASADDDFDFVKAREIRGIIIPRLLHCTSSVTSVYNDYPDKCARAAIISICQV